MVRANSSAFRPHQEHIAESTPAFDKVQRQKGKRLQPLRELSPRLGQVLELALERGLIA